MTVCCLTIYDDDCNHDDYNDDHHLDYDDDL